MKFFSSANVLDCNESNEFAIKPIEISAFFSEKNLTWVKTPKQVQPVSNQTTCSWAETAWTHTEFFWTSTATPPPPPPKKINRVYNMAVMI